MIYRIDAEKKYFLNVTEEKLLKLCEKMYNKFKDRSWNLSIGIKTKSSIYDNTKNPVGFTTIEMFRKHNPKNEVWISSLRFSVEAKIESEKSLSPRPKKWDTISEIERTYWGWEARLIETVKGGKYYFDPQILEDYYRLHGQEIVNGLLVPKNYKWNPFALLK